MPLKTMLPVAMLLSLMSLSAVTWSVLGAFDSGLMEACLGEEFQATCPDSDHVIVMELAFFGIRSVGRCADDAFGHQGCGRIVIRELDQLCSGRPSCNFRVSDELQDLHSCPKGLMSHLSAQYKCWPVITAQEASCRSDHPITLTDPAGNLSSYVTAQTARGSPACPWQLVVAPGQRINITLHNFSGSTSQCFKLGTVTEGGTVMPVTTCTPRRSFVYVSNSNRVQLDIIADSGDEHHFIFQYKAIGCPYPTVPSGMWVRRNADVAIVTCNNTDKSWRLQCTGQRWLGELGNCTPSNDENWQMGQFFSGNYFPYGILIIVAIGVALGVFLGGLLLVCVSRHFKRRRQMEQYHAGQEYAAGTTDRTKHGSLSDDHSLKALTHSPTSPHYERTSSGFNTVQEHGNKDCNCPFSYGTLPGQGLNRPHTASIIPVGRRMYESPRIEQDKRCG